MKNPDKGIWEFRNEDQHFTFSKVLCWVAIDRAIKISNIIQRGEKAKKWETLRNKIREDIMNNAWCSDKKAFTQIYGSSDLDASVLLMESYGFIEAKNPKYISTVEAIGRELLKNDLLFRYKNNDDFGEPKSSITVCTFCYINSLFKYNDIPASTPGKQEFFNDRNMRIITKDYDFGGSQHSEATDCLTDSDSWEPSDSVKGDIARILFYMVVRYDPGYDHDNNSFDLELVDYTTPNNNSPILGKLSSLIQWHYDDPVDDFEINRNEIIYGYQQNRNPFIDHPNLVSFLWGENSGENWNENLGIENMTNENLSIYPNPSRGVINFSNNLIDERIQIFSINGDKVYDRTITNNSIYLDLQSGFYLLKISNNSRVLNHKIIIR